MSQISVYNGYDREELDRQLDNSRAVPNHEEYFARYRELSAKSRAQREGRLDIPYGGGEMEKLDVFAAPATDGPTFIFVHGGWWRRLDKSDFVYVADPFVSAGISVVNVNYALAPNVTIPEIVREVRAATRWTFEHVRDWNGDPSRIFIGGHSVGGHLAALAAVTDPVAGLTTISGVHDVEPVFLSYVNEWARMGPEDVVPLSPIKNLPARRIPLIAAAGEKETDEFRRQTAIYARAWRERGYPVSERYPDHDHFSIMLELADAESELTREIVAQCLSAAKV
ncbi:MAG: alpha/beta hydrolase [Polyangiaceae bacterium]